jgi:hypothetical protein
MEICTIANGFKTVLMSNLNGFLTKYLKTCQVSL